MAVKIIEPTDNLIYKLKHNDDFLSLVKSEDQIIYQTIAGYMLEMGLDVYLGMQYGRGIVDSVDSTRYRNLQLAAASDPFAGFDNLSHVLSKCGETENLYVINNCIFQVKNKAKGTYLVPTFFNNDLNTKENAVEGKGFTLKYCPSMRGLSVNVDEVINKKQDPSQIDLYLIKKRKIEHLLK